jgi:uncharacterized membrane protein
MVDGSPEETNSWNENQNKSDEMDAGDLPVAENQVISAEVVGNTNAPSRLLEREVSVVWQEGPLPPAEEIAKYNQIIPNGADRIMAMAEKEQAHRQAIESMVVKSVSSQNERGQWFAFSVSISALIIAAYLFSIGKEGYAITLVCGDFLVIAGAFIGLRLWPSKDEKQEPGDEVK